MTPHLAATAALGAALAAALVVPGRLLLLRLHRPVGLPPGSVLPAAAVLGAAVGAAAGEGGAATVLGLLVGWCVLLAAADLAARRLPDVLTLPGAAGVLVAAAGAGRGGAAVLGGLALAAPHLGAHLLAPRSLGAGDVKLALGLGAASGACGSEAWVLAAVAAPVLTGLLAVVLVVRGRCGGARGGGARGRGVRGTVVPHGPAMCLATCLAVVGAVG